MVHAQVQLSLLTGSNDLRDMDGSLNLCRIRKNVFRMSAEKFADFLGVSASTYRSWEYKTRTPSGAALSLLKIAVAQPQLVQSILGDMDNEESAQPQMEREMDTISIAA